MFYARQTNVRITHIHVIAIRAVYDYEISPFEELLGKDKLETLYQRNIRCRVI